MDLLAHPFEGARRMKPTQHANIPSIVTGKMYKISFGHAGSHNSYDPSLS
jgi:hypothetical protein